MAVTAGHGNVCGHAECGQYAAGSGPAIEAIPVKNNGVTLTGGAFNAGATLVVDYQ